MMISRQKVAGMALAAVIAVAAALQVAPGRADHDQDDRVVLEFERMAGVPAAAAGNGALTRGIPGGFLPWVVGEANGKLTVTGKLDVRVRGLVFDPNAPGVVAHDQNLPPDQKIGGKNPIPDFKAIVSCLTIDQNGNLVVDNIVTDPFPADVKGNSNIHTHVQLPQPCIAPIVFVATPGAAPAWLAATGF